MWKPPCGEGTASALDPKPLKLGHQLQPYWTSTLAGAEGGRTDELSSYSAYQSHEICLCALASNERNLFLRQEYCALPRRVTCVHSSLLSLLRNLVNTSSSRIISLSLLLHLVNTSSPLSLFFNLVNTSSFSQKSYFRNTSFTKFESSTRFSGWCVVHRTARGGLGVFVVWCLGPPQRASGGFVGVHVAARSRCGITSTPACTAALPARPSFSLAFFIHNFSFTCSTYFAFAFIGMPLAAFAQLL